MVYHFDEGKNIFDQKTYEARIKAEAELMIALEAIKMSTVIFSKDLDSFNENAARERVRLVKTLAGA